MPPARRSRLADVARYERSDEGGPFREDACSVLGKRSLCPDLVLGGAATSLLTLLPGVYGGGVGFSALK